MSTTINGTDNSAAAPALVGSDTDTGVFFPAANTTAFSNGGTETMRIDSVGNVGVGTASPAAPFQVSKTFSDSAIEEIARLSRIGASPSSNNRAAALVFSDANNATLTAAVSGIRQNSNADFNGSLGFYTNNTGGSAATTVSQLTERMRIDSSGNVGIGTSSPNNYGGSFKTLQVTGGSTSYGGILRLTNSDSSRVGHVGVDSSAMFVNTATSTPIAFCIADAEKMRIDTYGNVGIGSSTPSSTGIDTGSTKLFVVTPNSSFGAAITAVADSVGRTIRVSNQSKNVIGVVDATDTEIIYGSNSVSPVKFITGGAERMRIDTSGVLCVGSSSNTWNVAGAIKTVGITSHAGQSGAYGGNGFNFYWNGNAQLWVDASNIGNIAFSSDYRIKRNIETQTESGIEKILKLRPVTYQMADYGDGLFKASDEVKEGFIAHEVQEVIPSGAEGEKDEENRIQNLRLDAILSVTVKAIQELKAELDEAKAEIALLKAK